MTVYEVYCGELFCGWALSYEDAINNAESNYRFGDPLVDGDYCLGNAWATNETNEGWRIVAKSLMVHEMQSRVLGQVDTGETMHFVWQCPQCGREYTDDVGKSTPDEVVVLCTCRTSDQRCYVLVHLLR